MKRTSYLPIVTAAIALTGAAEAQAAAPYKLCSTGPGNPIVSPRGGHCGHGQRTLRVARGSQISALRRRVATLEAKVRTLRTTLAGVSRSGNTLRFTRMNLQLVSGSGATDGAVNGLGNLIIGYNESPGGGQTGSHNLVLGQAQSFSSFGGIVAGVGNTVSGPFSAAFGAGNTASGSVSAVFGFANTASGMQSSVLGGDNNTASGPSSSVSGGSGNTASDSESSVAGGGGNTASGQQSSVSGGSGNTASGLAATARGGQSQSVTADYGYAP